MGVSYYAYPGLRFDAMSRTQRRHLRKGKSMGDHKLILPAVCEYYHVTVEELQKRCRKRRLVWCRQVYYYLSAKLTNLSLLEIGEPFTKDHTTVIHGKDTVKDIIDTDLQKLKEVEELEAILAHKQIASATI